MNFVLRSNIQMDAVLSMVMVIPCDCASHFGCATLCHCVSSIIMIECCLASGFVTMSFLLSNMKMYGSVIWSYDAVSFLIICTDDCADLTNLRCLYCCTAICKQQIWEKKVLLFAWWTGSIFFALYRLILAMRGWRARWEADVSYDSLQLHTSSFWCYSWLRSLGSYSVYLVLFCGFLYSSTIYYVSFSHFVLFYETFFLTMCKLRVRS